MGRNSSIRSGLIVACTTMATWSETLSVVEKRRVLIGAVCRAATEALFPLLLRLMDDVAPIHASVVIRLQPNRPRMSIREFLDHMLIVVAITVDDGCTATLSMDDWKMDVMTVASMVNGQWQNVVCTAQKIVSFASWIVDLESLIFEALPTVVRKG
jgi:hypothetical protein